MYNGKFLKELIFKNFKYYKDFRKSQSKRLIFGSENQWVSQVFVNVNPKFYFRKFEPSKICRYTVCQVVFNRFEYRVRYARSEIICMLGSTMVHRRK